MAKGVKQKTTPWTGEQIAAFAKAVSGTDEIPWHQKLRLRMEDEFLWFYALEQEPVGKDKGKWETVIDNSPRVYADKLIQEHASGLMRFNIPNIGKPRKHKKDDPIFMTEQAVYGLRNLADDFRTTHAGGVSGQAAAAWYTNITGFVIGVFLMTEAERHGEQIVVPDLQLWDFADTYWEDERWDVARIVNTSWISGVDAKNRYGKDFADDGQGVEVHTFYDAERWQIEIQNEIVEESTHGLGYCPAKVVTSGTMPMPANVDRMIYMAPSCWARAKEIWLARSKIMTYRMTNIRNQVYRGYKAYYDSDKQGVPVTVLKDPTQPNVMVPLNIAKGQELTPMEVVEMTRDAAAMDAVLAQGGVRGSAPDVLYGQLDRDTTAQGTAMLIRAAMGSLDQGKKAIEEFHTWFANEAVSQCKRGKELGWKEVHVQGTDAKNGQFSMEIDFERLVTTEKIKAELNIDKPQDELENLAKAIEAKKAGLLPHKMILDTIVKVLDADAAMDMLSAEKTEELTGISLRREQAEYIREGDILGAAEIEKLIESLQQRLLNAVAPITAPPTPEMAGEEGGAMPIQGMVAGKMAGVKPTNRMRQNIRTMTGQ